MFVQAVGDVFHDDARTVPVNQEIVNTRDVRVREAGGNPGFSPKGLNILGFCRGGLVHHFQRDGSPEVGIFGSIYGALSACADSVQDPVFTYLLLHWKLPDKRSRPKCFCLQII